MPTTCTGGTPAPGGCTLEAVGTQRPAGPRWFQLCRLWQAGAVCTGSGGGGGHGYDPPGLGGGLSVRVQRRLLRVHPEPPTPRSCDTPATGGVPPSPPHSCDRATHPRALQVRLPPTRAARRRLGELPSQLIIRRSPARPQTILAGFHGWRWGWGCSGWHGPSAWPSPCPLPPDQHCPLPTGPALKSGPPHLVPATPAFPAALHLGGRGCNRMPCTWEAEVQQAATGHGWIRWPPPPPARPPAAAPATARRVRRPPRAYCPILANESVQLTAAAGANREMP